MNVKRIDFDLIKDLAIAAALIVTPIAWIVAYVAALNNALGG